MLIVCWIIYRLYDQTLLLGSPPFSITVYYWVFPLEYPAGTSDSELVQIWTHHRPPQTTPSPVFLFSVNGFSSQKPGSHAWFFFLLQRPTSQPIISPRLFKRQQALLAFILHMQQKWSLSLTFFRLKPFGGFEFSLGKCLTSYRRLRGSPGSALLSLDLHHLTLPDTTPLFSWDLAPASSVSSLALCSLGLKHRLLLFT